MYFFDSCQMGSDVAGEA